MFRLNVTPVEDEFIIDLTTLNAAQGFIIQGDAPFDRAGSSVSSAGDVNGDGFDDLIVGAPRSNNGGTVAGEAYVVFGGVGGFGVADGAGRRVIDLTTLTAAQGFIIQGDAAGDYAGRSVSSAGDVNGDGFDDLIVGALGGDDGGNIAGEAYVVFGGASGFGVADGAGRRVIDLTTLTAAQGFIIQGDSAVEKAGASVSSAGDIYGDGFDDLIVGAPQGGYSDGSIVGRAYVVFGSSTGAGSLDAGGRQVIDLTTFTAAHGFIIQGNSNNDYAGFAVAGAGDVNGDGFDDLIVGAYRGDDGGNYAGEAYVVFGSAGGFGSLDANGRRVIDLTTLAAEQGFIIQGDLAYDNLGYAIARAGDINGDGFDDLILGSRRTADGETFGSRIYVVYGSNKELGSPGSDERQVLDLAILTPTKGFIIQGDAAGDYAGRSVAGAGDINGDGFDDLIVGAYRGDDGGNYAGEAYVIYGGSTGTEDTAPVARSGTAVPDNFTGNAGADTFTDIATGDVVHGGAGNDSIAVTSLNFADIHGGLGLDTLALAGAGMALDLTTTPRPRLDSIEVIDLTGSGNNSLTVSDLAIFQLTAERSAGEATLFVKGNAGDIVSAIGFTAKGSQTVDGITYALFEKGNANLLVEMSVGVDARAFIDLTTLSAAQGFIIQGDSEGDFVGYSVSSVGDVNGDGFDDLIVGAYRGDDGGSDAGEAYVVFGSASGFGSPVTIDGVTRQVIDLTTLTAAQGFIIQGDVAGAFAGLSVSLAGDVNGDGFDDLIVGARYGGDGGFRAGDAYVVFGTASGLGTADGAGRRVIDLTTLNAAQGFIIQGDAAFDYAGRSVSLAGDVNGDGFDDLIIGAPFGDDGGDSAGEAYVVFGRASGFGSPVTIDGVTRRVIDLTTLTAAQGFIIQGDSAFDFAGRSVSSAGDVNGDGFDDLIVGVPNGDDGGSTAGEARVVFGSASGFGSPVTIDGVTRRVIDLTTLSAAQGFIIQGDAANNQAGCSVSSAGDVNGDGFDDLIIGAFAGADGGIQAGEAYVVFGSASGFGSPVTIDGVTRQVIDLTTLTAAQGFIIQGDAAFDYAGLSVSLAGDVNGDGFDDLIVGATGGDDGGNSAGEAYVVFGSASGFGGPVTIDGVTRQVIDLTTLSVARGFIIQGDAALDRAGRSVSSAGDVNGDGFDDLIVGASGGDDGGNYAGEAYVVFGGATGTEDFTPLTRIGTAAVDNFTGNAGNDSFTGIATGDVVRGGAGNDSIEVTSLDFAHISGGRGTNALALAGAGLTLDLTTVPRPRLDSIEVIDLTGTGNNSLRVSDLAIFQLTDERSAGEATLFVKGNAGDSVSAIGFTANGSQTVDGITYSLFEKGNANLLVEIGVGVSVVGG